MAFYKDAAYLQSHNDAAFDAIHSPGQAATYSGIYRCLGCGREVVSDEHKSLPPQNHHQHVQSQGAIRWKLIVYADHAPKH